MKMLHALPLGYLTLAAVMGLLVSQSAVAQPNSEMRDNLVTEEAINPCAQVESLDPQVVEDCLHALEPEEPALAAEIRAAFQRRDFQRMRLLLQQLEQARAERMAAKEEAERLEPAIEAERRALTADRSTIEALLTGPIDESIDLNIQQFGYRLFQRETAAFQPGINVPVGPNYLVGPGDEFTVTVSGMVDGTYQVKVSAEGEVVFPKIGPVPLVGVKFGELQAYLARVFSKHFKEFTLTIAMTRLRSIQVFIVGEVTNPGAYQLSSLSTLLHALFAAGGPTKNGTLRKIQLRRQGRVVASTDLYAFLLEGDKSQDLPLQDQDTVFVPLIGPVVGVAGQVHRPAIYEVVANPTLRDVMALAGGVRPTGYLTRVQVERVVAHEQKIVVDFNLSQRDATPVTDMAIPVQNLDMVKVFPILPKTEDVVFLQGHVRRPGMYQLKPGMRLTDILRNHTDLNDEPYMDYAKIVRLAHPDGHQVVVPIDLGRALAGVPDFNPLLQSQDTIVVFSKAELGMEENIVVKGAVRKPGPVPLVRDMRVSDAIVMAGGLKKEAYLGSAELTRYHPIEGREIETEVITIDLARALQRDSVHDVLLQDHDMVLVQTIPDLSLGWTVSVLGHVKFPGEYSIRPGDRLSSVLDRAGGYSERAYVKGAIFTRVSVAEHERVQLAKLVKEQQQRVVTETTRRIAAGGTEAETAQQALEGRLQVLSGLLGNVTFGRMVIHLQPLDALKGSTHDVELENGDVLFVPAIPSSVTVHGSVMNQIAIQHKQMAKVDYYLDKAGGFAENADRSRIHILKVDGSVVASRLKRQVLDPGDAIIVPPKVEAEFSPLEFWSRIMTIVGQTVISIASVAVIAVAL